MKVPVVEQTVRQRGLEIPESNLRADPATFGAGMARAIDETRRVSLDVAQEETRVATEMSVTENSQTAQRVSSAETQQFQTLKGKDAMSPEAKAKAVERAKAAWTEGINNGVTPHAREILSRFADRDIGAMERALDSHAIDQGSKYKEFLNGERLQAAETKLNLNPLDLATNLESIVDVRTAVALANPGIDKDAIKPVQDRAVSAALIRAYAAIPKDANPDKAKLFYERNKEFILPSKEKAAIEETLAGAVNDWKAEGLARAAVVKFPNDMVSAMSFIEQQVGSDTALLDKTRTRYESRVKTQLFSTAKAMQDAGKEGLGILQTHGYDITSIPVSLRTAMGPNEYQALVNIADTMKSRAESDIDRAERKAAEKGEYTPQQRQHQVDFLNFATNIKNAGPEFVAPRYNRANWQSAVEDGDLQNINTFNIQWLKKLGPYWPQGLALWKDAEQSYANPGQYTARSDNATAEILGVLREAGRIPEANVAASKWTNDQLRLTERVKIWTTDAAATEQAKSPSWKPNPQFWRDSAKAAITDIVLRGDPGPHIGLDVKPTELYDPRKVMSTDEVRYREWFHGWFRKRHGGEPNENDLLYYMSQWEASGKPELPNVVHDPQLPTTMSHGR